jgi:hypothetical protein
MQQRRAIIGAVLLVGLGVVLGTTVLRTDIAQATGLAQPPQPVREKNLDGNGNIRVHEQGRVRVQGTVSARAVAPASPWSDSEGLTIGGNSDALLAGPNTTIDLTSFGTSVSPGDHAYVSLIVEYVPDTATNCSAASGGAIVYALDNVSGPVSVAFPTPLPMTAPSGQKACLFGSAGGTGGSSGGHADLNASGFYG